MSFTVAPLTAAVMGSVSDHFSGTASGVNNALTRIANVFANAILGALAVLFFTGALQGEIKKIKLNDKQKQEVIKQSVNLGNAKVPDIFTGQDKAIIEKAYKNSFISAYGDIMRISAGLGFLGSLMAVLFIRNSAVKKEKE
jgi:preprotein translocase subunit SecG